MTNKRVQLERPLPNAEAAERMCLGAVLLDNQLAYELFAELSPNDFYSPIHRAIAHAMKRLIEMAKPIDPVLLANEMPDQNIDISTIANLTFGLPFITSLKEHIAIIKKMALSRRLIKICNASLTSLLDGSDPETVRDTLTATLNGLQHGLEANVELKDVASKVRLTFEEWAQDNTAMSSLHTGIPELDTHLRLRGLGRGELTLIAARPSVGKTALLIQIATHVARLGIPVLFVSLEMLREQIVMRMLPPITNIANKAINPHTLKTLPNERERLYSALDKLTYPIYFDRSFTLPRLISRAEHFVRTKGVQLVVFDYLTLIKSGTRMEQFDKANAVGEIVNGLKELAVGTNTAVLGAAQFSRRIDQMHRRPRMSDLRDSGVIEQAADVILFPYDPNSQAHASNPDTVIDNVWLDLYCEKQRNGERYWNVKLEYDKNLQTFESPAMSGKVAPIPGAPEPVSYRDWHDDDDDE
jgi:replicative DNA helicase